MISVSKTERDGTWSFGKSTMGDWRYRFYQVWITFFKALMLIFLVLLYREWKKLGGDKNYAPPEA